MRLRIATGITLRVVAAAALIAAAAFAMFAGAPAAQPAGPTPSAQPLTIIATWTGTEGAEFQKILRGFANKTGIHVNYVGTSAAGQLLESDIQQSNPPDLAILPSPATLLQYARLGYLTNLVPVIGKRQISAYDHQWQDIMKLGTSTLYALPFKVQVHNLVWYDPQNWPGKGRPFHESAPTWSQLSMLEQHITAGGGTPWCVGLDSTPVSGWPAADWIGDILLHQSGIPAYEQWADGELDWTSRQVKTAWQTWGSLVTGQVYGGSLAALVTEWDSAGMPMFGPAPGCYLQHAPSFITLHYHEDGRRPGTDYDFFPFPMAGLPDQARGVVNRAWEVTADLLAMFRDTPQAKSLVTYLAGEQTQQIWPDIPYSGATSANMNAQQKIHSDPVAQAVAGMVTDTSGTLCFNASDEMPDTLQSAFYQGVMEYLQNPSPTQLQAILQRLNQVQQTTYETFLGGHPDFHCGKP